MLGALRCLSIPGQQFQAELHSAAGKLVSTAADGCCSAKLRSFTAPRQDLTPVAIISSISKLSLAQGNFVVSCVMSELTAEVSEPGDTEDGSRCCV